MAMTTIYTTELIDLLHERLNADQRTRQRGKRYSKAETGDILGIVQDCLVQILAEPEQAVVLHRFGKLYTSATSPRQIKSNLTGETHQVEARRRVHFQASSRLQETINEW